MTLIGSPDLELWKNPPTSASIADDITFFIISERVRTAPLDLLILLKFYDPMSNWHPTRLISYISDIYDGSMCMLNDMFLVWYLNLAYMCVAQQFSNWDTTASVSSIPLYWSAANGNSATRIVGYTALLLPYCVYILFPQVRG